MTHAKHTPGPWEVKYSAKGTFIGNADMKRVADIYEHSDFGSTCAINARLIAAAPYMLAAIENAIEKLDIIIESRGPGYGASSAEIDVLTFLEDAIAKATAES